MAGLLCIATVFRITVSGSLYHRLNIVFQRQQTVVQIAVNHRNQQVDIGVLAWVLARIGGVFGKQR